jgi:hypothetical protein
MTAFTRRGLFGLLAGLTGAAVARKAPAVADAPSFEISNTSDNHPLEVSTDYEYRELFAGDLLSLTTREEAEARAMELLRDSRAFRAKVADDSFFDRGERARAAVTKWGDRS